MAHILLCPLGSHGDVHPLVGLGVALAARGHAITLVATETFAPLADRHGFAFAAVGTDEEYQAKIRHPDLWHPSRSMKVILGPDLVGKLLPLAFGHIRDRYDAGNTVVVAGSLALAARLAQEALGVPLATVHLQPLAFQSAVEVPNYAQWSYARYAPPWFARLAYWGADRFILDPLLGPPLNKLRTELGMPPLRRIWGTWRNSPQLILGLFPKWFANAPDWPTQTKLTGFLRYDQGEPAMPAKLGEWLSAGSPPVVFSFGSAMRHGKPYFTAAAEACRLGGFRGLILAKGTEQVPDSLPDGVKHFDYAPFSVVFPRAAAVVHHGGIGTVAQALAAGVRQLIMPLAFDQPDNALRLVKLGVARVLPPKRFTADAVKQELEALRDAKYTTAAKQVAAKLAADPDPAMEAVRHVEALIGADRK